MKASVSDFQWLLYLSIAFQYFPKKCTQNVNYISSEKITCFTDYNIKQYLWIEGNALNIL